MKKKMSFTNFVLLISIVLAVLAKTLPAVLYFGFADFLKTILLPVIDALCIIALFVIAFLGCNKPDEMEKKLLSRSMRLAFSENLFFITIGMVAVKYFPTRFHNDVYHFGSYILYVSFFEIII